MSPLAQTAACQNLPLAGRVSHFIKNWEIITQDSWVLNCVKDYTINLLSKPHQLAPPKELNFSKEETLNLSKEVQIMVDKNAISRVCTKTGRFPITTVHGSKERWGPKPIINLNKLNSFVHMEHFKMEGIHMLKHLLKPSDWMTKVNLKDAYYTSSDKPQEVAAVQVARRNLPVQLSPFQVVVDSVGL